MHVPLRLAQLIGAGRGLWIPRSQNRDLHPTDEDLSVGTPDLGHPALPLTESGPVECRGFPPFRQKKGGPRGHPDGARGSGLQKGWSTGLG